ncbi:MAG: hypothetical protein U0Q15_10060 [Kineosporiaceae bacterium]
MARLRVHRWALILLVPTMSLVFPVVTQLIADRGASAWMSIGTIVVWTPAIALRASGAAVLTTREYRGHGYGGRLRLPWNHVAAVTMETVGDRVHVVAHLTDGSVRFLPHPYPLRERTMRRQGAAARHFTEQYHRIGQCWQDHHGELVPGEALPKPAVKPWHYVVGEP